MEFDENQQTLGLQDSLKSKCCMKLNVLRIQFQKGCIILGHKQIFKFRRMSMLEGVPLQLRKTSNQNMV
jgi:hypothetical protein